MARTNFIENLKQQILDTLIAAGGADKPDHSHVELFSLSSSKWQNKADYPSTRLRRYSILAVEKKFILFGEKTEKRKVLINQLAFNLDLCQYQISVVCMAHQLIVSIRSKILGHNWVN